MTCYTQEEISATMRKTLDGPETGSDTTTEIVSRHGLEAR